MSISHPLPVAALLLTLLSQQVHAAFDHPNIIRVPVPFFSGSAGGSSDGSSGGSNSGGSGGETPPSNSGYLYIGETTLDATSGSARTALRNDSDSPIVLNTDFMMRQLCSGMEMDYTNSLISDGMRDGLFAGDFSTITLPPRYSSSLAFGWVAEYNNNCTESMTLKYSVNGENHTQDLIVRANGVRTGNFVDLSNVSFQGHTFYFRINNPLVSRALSYRLVYSVNGIDPQTHYTYAPANYWKDDWTIPSGLWVIPSDVQAMFNVRIYADSINEYKDYQFPVMNTDIRWLHYYEIYTINGEVRESQYYGFDFVNNMFDLKPKTESSHGVVFTLPEGAHVVYRYERGTDYYPSHHACPTVTASVEGSPAPVETTSDSRYCFFDVNLEGSKGKLAAITFDFPDADMNTFTDTFDYR